MKEKFTLQLVFVEGKDPQKKAELRQHQLYSCHLLETSLFLELQQILKSNTIKSKLLTPT